MSGREGWLGAREQGSALGIRFFAVLVTLLGRGAGRAALLPVMLYYFLCCPSVRRASRTYLERMGEPRGWRRVYCHLLRFGQCTLDRVFFVRGRAELFDVRTHGQEHLEELRQQKRGAILLGGHVGSFEAMRAYADVERFTINIVVNHSNAQMVNRVLEGLDPKSNVRLVEVGSDSMDFVFRIRELIECGQLVAIMGDRADQRSRAASVPFLGAHASLPTGAYVLASVLKCPIYLTFGLYRGGNRYDLHCEPFAARVDMPRGSRREALEQLAARYAGRLEYYCKLAPDNWFNFYDFWACP